jgi:hypothetical protein
LSQADERPPKILLLLERELMLLLDLSASNLPNWFNYCDNESVGACGACARGKYFDLWFLIGPGAPTL